MPHRRIDASAKALFLRPEDMDRSVALLLLAARGFEASARSGLPPELALTHRLMILLVKTGVAETAADLRRVLALPKQTVSRQVRQLIDAGLAEQVAGAGDRRRKVLALTAAGRELADRLDRAQRRRLGTVFRSHGPETVAHFESVLVDLVDPRARAQFQVPEVRS